MKRGSLTTEPEIAEKILQHDEEIIWEGGPTVPIVWRFWVGVIFLVLGVIYYGSALSVVRMPAYLPIYLFLDSFLLIMPYLVLSRLRSTRGLSFYVTTQRIIIERGYHFRWLFFPEIGETRTSDRASFVTMLGLKHVYFRSKSADTARRWTPDEHGVVYALCKDEHGYYEYPPRPITQIGFYYLTKTEANHVKQLVENNRRGNLSP